MQFIDEIHLQWPFCGSQRMRDELEERGRTVSRTPIQRPTRQINLRTLYPRRRTSQPGKGHTIDPYLLRICPSNARPKPWQVTSATSRWPRGSYTCCRSWTGTLAGCCHERCPIPWIRTSVSKPWRTLYSALNRRRSSMRTSRGPPSAPLKHSPSCLTAMALRSPWMARTDGRTPCSSSVCGAASSTSTCTRVPTELRARLARYFDFYNPCALTAYWTDTPRMRCTSTKLTATWKSDNRARFHLPHCPILGVHFCSRRCGRD